MAEVSQNPAPIVPQWLQLLLLFFLCTACTTTTHAFRLGSDLVLKFRPTIGSPFPTCKTDHRCRFQGNHDIHACNNRSRPVCSLETATNTIRPRTRLLQLRMSQNHEEPNLQPKASTEINDNNNKNDNDDYSKGLWVLVTVPMAWGTFEPAVRLVYKYEPMMPPLLFSCAYYFVATLLLTLSLTTGTIYSGKSKEETIEQQRATSSETTGPMNTTTTAKTIADTNNDDMIQQTTPLSTLGGIELGTYLFVGNSLQVIGLKTVPSDRAAVLLQLTTIFVPLLKSATTTSRVRIVGSTWLACLVALAGVALVGLDHPSETITRVSSWHGASVDDLCIVMAAVFYTFHCVRLETYARSPTVSALGLATSKAATELLWSLASIGLCLLLVRGLVGSDVETIPSLLEAAKSSGERLLFYGNNLLEQQQQQQFPSSDSIRVGLATLWTGAVTVAYTIYAQSYGQSRVPAVVANLVYSSQPIFTAIVAYLVLGESTLGIQGYTGGLLIGGAVLLVIAAEAEAANADDDDSSVEDDEP